jgi:hypothetical protein
LTLGYPPFDEQFEIQATDTDLARRLIGRPLADALVAGEIPAQLSSLLLVADLLGR